MNALERKTIRECSIHGVQENLHSKVPPRCMKTARTGTEDRQEWSFRYLLGTWKRMCTRICNRYESIFGYLFGTWKRMCTRICNRYESIFGYLFGTWKRMCTRICNRYESIFGYLFGTRWLQCLVYDDLLAKATPFSRALHCGSAGRRCVCCRLPDRPRHISIQWRPITRQHGEAAGKLATTYRFDRLAMQQH
jgi:ribosomal protein S17E